MKTKICSKCKKEKPIVEFYKDRNRKDGLSYICKKCASEDYKKYRQENREKLREYNGQYYQKNKEKYKEDAKKNREKRKVEKPYRFWASMTLRSHRAKGYKVNITLDEVENMALLTINCPICGVEMGWKQHNRKYIRTNSPTLDRKYNERELNKDNVWIICNRCNSAKGVTTLEEFVKYCRTIVSKFKDR